MFFFTWSRAQPCLESSMLSGCLRMSDNSLALIFTCRVEPKLLYQISNFRLTFPREYPFCFCENGTKKVNILVFRKNFAEIFLCQLYTSLTESPLLYAGGLVDAKRRIGAPQQTKRTNSTEWSSVWINFWDNCNWIEGTSEECHQTRYAH